ncbi:MAG: histidinol dehydrogenase [Verrucomicrobia bacterium]|nr:histidinol dehydrogenase [Verrucomicrobiota bacterium]
MRLLRIGAPHDAKRLERLLDRRSVERGVEPQVRPIVSAVQRRGDRAVIEYTRKFDGVALSPARLRVSAREIKAALDTVDPTLLRAMREAKRNVEAYHRRQRRASWTMKAASGAVLGERIVPLRRVACYVPGGVAPLVSTVLMTAVPARVAGVSEVVVATPPGPRGRVNGAILAACAVCGVDEVYRVGGAQAIAALAYGTRTIPRVDKIVGPGNMYVMTAKKLVYGDVALDAPSGPSEILVLADTTADPQWIAADVLSQAEHGTGHEYALLVTTSKRLAEQVRDAIRAQLDELPMSSRMKKRIEGGIALVVAPDMAKAIEFTNSFGAEHLEILARDARRLSTRLTDAGAIFIGPYSPVPVGDFAAGPSHCLPTGGASAMFGGLSVDEFVRRVSTIECTRAALAKLAPVVEAFADAEHLPAHARAVRERFKR